MRIGLEDALDQCLAGLTKGEDLETCLQRFPDLRDELEPLVRTLVLVKSAYKRPSPSQATLARGRARFMAEVAKRSRAQKPKRRFVGLAWPHFAWGRGWATAALTLVLMLALLWGGAAVSANSLPGDPLYGVKRASEEVRYFFTFSAEARAMLQREYEELRVVEVKKVVEQGRNVEVQFKGTVEKVEGDQVFVNGIPVRVDAALVSSEQLQVGSEIQVVAKTQSKEVQAKSVAVRTQPTMSAAPTAFPQLLATATPSPQQRPTSALTDAPPKPSATPLPTFTPEPSSTATVLPTSALTATQTATRVAPATPSRTPSVALTPTLTHTPMPTPTSAPPPRDIVVRVEGRIDEIGAGFWVVANQRFILQASTQIVETRARAQVGGTALVNGVKRSDGTLVAHEIVVLSGPAYVPLPREFSGAIESFSKERWVVAGREVIIAAETTIEGQPEVGALAHVQALQQADGRLIARRIVVEPRSEPIVQFEGRIEEFSSTRWVVAGQEVLIGPNTHIEGTPVVGALAAVEAVVRSDGSKLARRIVVTPLPPTQVPPSATPRPPTPVSPTSVSPTPLSPTPTETPKPITETPAAPSPTPTAPTPSMAATATITPAPASLSKTRTVYAPTRPVVLLPMSRDTVVHSLFTTLIVAATPTPTPASPLQN